MKKLIILTSTLILLLTIAGTALAATQAIAVSQVLGSSNTDASGPVSYLSDGNQSTPWTISGKPSSAWAQLQLASPILIDGLQIYGPCLGQLTIQYWQNGSWHNFIAADHLKGETFGAGWNLLDLSYDRIVTNQIRLWLDNSQQLSQIGGIGEVMVLGRSSQDVLERLDPVTVTGNRNSDSNHPAAYLFDRDTYSAWWMNGGTPANGEAVADLGEICTIQRIKVFGGSDGSGQFKLQYLSGSNWLDIPGLTNLSISQIGAAWKSFNLPNWISTNQIKAVINSTQRVGGIREIEIWGRKATPTGSSYLDTNQTSVLLNSTTSANYTFNITNSLTTPAILHVVTEGSSATPLTWELNGQTMGNLSPVGTIRGLTVYQQVISSNLLWSGVNFIQINGANLTVRDCKLEISGAHTLTFSGSLSDRWLLTPVTGSEQIIELGSTYNIDDIVLSYLGSQLPVQIAIDQNGSWVTLTGIPANNTGTVGGELSYSWSGLIHRIKVDFNPGASSFTELTIHGSRVNDGAPQVKILSPINGTFFNLTTWGAGYITGTVDNPDATVRVNGQGMTLTGTSFNIPLPVAGNPDSSKVIQVVATDSQGRTGSDQVTINISNPPDFTVNLADQLIYTSQAQITVSGQVVVPQSKVTINDVAVSLTNLNFSKAVALNEGLNLITIKVMPPGNPQWATIQRRVIRTSNPPYLKVLAPVDGQVVKDSQITVSGQVSSLTPVTVTVNGKAATVSSGYFSSSSITLVDGPNKLTVVATDQNGLTSQVVLTVKRDQTPPLLTGVTPADGVWLNTLNVTVAGTASDTSPVSVLVNGQAATLIGSQFSLTLAVKEGANPINIQATDSAGNVTTITRTINIDTNPPAAFTPVASPASWTSNNMPTISFLTTDSESGIDHYEIGVDGGTTSKGSSPYTFVTAIVDGEHTVQVKAFDKAGNVTLGMVEIYIDTTPPVVPAGFEVISSIGRVIINWQDPQGEVVGYRVNRTPAFSGGSSVNLTRTSDTALLNQYIDQDVTPGVSYIYTLQALDHGGNYSQSTQPIAATVGIASKAVDTNGGTVKFDTCTITLPSGTLTDSYTVVIKQGDPAPANQYAAGVSPMYSFSLQDQTGATIPTQFNQPVTLQISYQNMTIPAGYTDQNLGVYWYNEELGDWEKLDHVGIDPVTKTLTTILGHFSEYQVMASQYVSPSLDSYYKLGVSPFQSYFNDNQELVSGTSGSLSVIATDLKLPGRSGFDLILKRSYDGEANRQSRLLESNQFDGPKYAVDTFGDGWALNIPWVENNDGGDFIRLPEGQTFQITSNNFEYTKGPYFKLKTHTHQTWTFIFPSTAIDGYTLTLSDGTVYQLDKNGKPTQETDPSGMNTVTYSYNGRQLTKIIDSIGREIDFSYKQIQFTIDKNKITRNVITQISYANGTRKIQYQYDPTSGMLSSVLDPMNRLTQYTYEAHDITTGKNSYNSITSVSLLNSITYPTGGVSKYQYQPFDQQYKDNGSTYQGMQYLVSSHVLADKTTNYSFNLNTEAFGEINSYYFIAPKTYIYSCDITEGQKVTTQTVQQLVQPIASRSNYHLANVPGSFENDEGSLIVSSQIVSDGKPYETVSYTYNQLPLQLANIEAHCRGGNWVFNITNTYDGWGNLTQQIDGSRNLEEDWSYYKPSDLPFKNLVYTDTKKNVNPVNGTISNQTITYQYNDATGKPIQMTVNDGTRDIVTTFGYDGYGNLSQKIQSNDPDSLETDFTYETTYNAFPEKKILKDIKDADGNVLGCIISKYGYDYFGNKLLEENPTGYFANPDAYVSEATYRTSYTYDLLNRVTQVTLPMDSDTNTPPTRQYYFNDTPDKDGHNSCDFYNEKGQHTQFIFDGLGRLIEIDKYTDGTRYAAVVSTNYTYDNMGRIESVTDAKNNTTNYQYDGMNRVTQVTYADTNYVTLAYDDVTNTVSIFDENDHKNKVVAEQSDWANQLKEARQYCSYGGNTTVYTWDFQYDSFGNKVSQTDPNWDMTVQTFDTLNHLTTVTLPGDSLIAPNSETVSYITPKLIYQYDKMGNKVSETSANGNKIVYTYDQLGRQVMVTTYKNDGLTPISTTKTYYDAVGNKKQIIDDNKGQWNYSYSVRGYLLSEEDPEHHLTQYRYDPLGNKIAVIDPRNTSVAPVTWFTISDNTNSSVAVTVQDNRSDKSFTTWYLYDDLNKLYRTVLPSNTPPTDPYAVTISDNYFYTETTYDAVGNKLSVRDANGLRTNYTYTSRYWVDTVTQNNQTKYTYTYNNKGNQTDALDSLNHNTHKDYDSLNRLRNVLYPSSLTQETYNYDGVGNRVSVSNGRGDTTTYSYNSLGWLTGVRDPLLYYTQYNYDPSGNQVQIIAANGLLTKNHYDELNRLTEHIDAMNHKTTYTYDGVGNRIGMTDPRNSHWVYQYNPENLLKQLNIIGANVLSSYQIQYTYDEAGNRKTINDSKNTVSYNLQNGSYQPDPLNQVTSVDRTFDGATYRTEYQYTPGGLLTQILYPGASSPLVYNYDNFNRLSEVVGFTKPQGIGYNTDDTLKNINYTNGVIATYGYDAAQRLQDLNVNYLGTNILQQQYSYKDKTNNIETITDANGTKTYHYDVDNQLTYASTPGKFLETKTTSGTTGSTFDDYLGTSWLNFSVNSQATMTLDFASTSIGLDFGTVAPGVKRIVLTPDKDHQNHRIGAGTFAIYTSNDNSNYTLVSGNRWTFVNNNGVITISLNDNDKLTTRYLKLHVKFDDRDTLFQPVNKAQFLNQLSKMLTVYQEATSQTEEYQYDPVGNRTLQKITLVQVSNYSSLYYTNSDRLKTDGKFAFKYDAAGNLTEKGNTYTISGDKVTFTATSGDEVEYWQYKYDLLNRLIEVDENMASVPKATYGYSPDGLRQVKTASGVTTHYVFEGTEPIFEKNTSTGKIKNFIYALGKHLARVDGHEATVDGKIVQIVDNTYYYHTDHLGSVRAVTNSTGTVVWNADYQAFGTQFGKNKVDPNFEEDDVAFTGKEIDKDTGLYYFNARWYDSETGRFIQEDPVGDPNNPNLYSYAANNPLNRVDPSGLESYEPGCETNDDGSTTDTATGITTYYNSIQKSSEIKTYYSDGTSKVNNFAYGMGFSWEGPIQYDYGHMIFEYNLFKELYPDYNEIDHDKFQEFVKAQELTDPESLYVAARVGLENPNFSKSPNGDTWCNAYAGYVLYLLTGSTDLMKQGSDPKDYNNFTDRKDWIIDVNDQYDRVTKGEYIGTRAYWTQVDDPATAQQLANIGKFVIAITTGSKHDQHIAIIMPGDAHIIVDVNSKTVYPAIAQQGNTPKLPGEYKDSTLDYGWGPGLRDKVQYYVY
jgi:RHS repeat-associated protein